MVPLIGSQFSTQSRRFARNEWQFQSNLIYLSCPSSGFSWPSLVQRKAVLWSQLLEENQKDATISQLAKKVLTQRLNKFNPNTWNTRLGGCSAGDELSAAMFWHLKACGLLSSTYYWPQVWVPKPEYLRRQVESRARIRYFCRAILHSRLFNLAHLGDCTARDKKERPGAGFD